MFPWLFCLKENKRIQLGLTSSSGWWATGGLQAAGEHKLALYSFRNVDLWNNYSEYLFIFVDVCALMYLIHLEAWILTVQRPKRVWSKNRCNIFTILRQCNRESTNIFFSQWKFFYWKEICLLKGRMISKYCESGRVLNEHSNYWI